MFDLPIDLSVDRVKQEMVFFSHKFFNHSHFYSIPCGGIIKIAPQEDYENYHQLPCADVDRNKIVELITTIGTKGKIDLLLHHKARLEKMGDEIDEKVHPLRFLAVIFSNPQLKSYMGAIKPDYFKWSNFIHGLSKRLNVEMKKGCVLKFLDGFSLELNIPEENIRSFCEKKDWQGLVEYLISH